MWLQSLNLSNFRNIFNAEIELNKFVNVFFGKNAQGKTSILEAVYLIFNLKSFRAKNTSEILMFGRKVFTVKCSFVAEKIPYNIKFVYANGQKNWFLNNEKIKDVFEIIKKFPVVILTEENISIVDKSPSFMRKFLDLQLSQSFSDYIETLKSYNKALAARNYILKKKNNFRELGVWTKFLVDSGAKIYEMRKKAIERLKIFARLNYQKISENKEELEIIYLSQINMRENEDLKKVFLNELKKVEKKEMEKGYTLVGPHRDNLMFMINKKKAVSFASSGQKKTIGFAIKLAEIQNIKSFSREEPVVLIDDVFGELDEKRKANVFSLLSKNRQILFSTSDKYTAKEILKTEKNRSVFVVEKGSVKSYGAK